MKVILEKIKKIGKEYIFGKMVKNLKGIGKIINLKEKENIIIIMEIKMKVILKMINQMEKE